MTQGVGVFYKVTIAVIDTNTAAKLISIQKGQYTTDTGAPEVQVVTRHGVNSAVLDVQPGDVYEVMLDYPAGYDETSETLDALTNRAGGIVYDVHYWNWYD